VPQDVLAVIGVGGMGQAIARRLGAGKTVLLADYNDETLQAAAAALSADGHDVHTRTVDVASAESVRALAKDAAALGRVTQVAHTAGLSPSQADAPAVLAVDLLGVALVLDEFVDVIAPGGAGVVIASMAGHMFPALAPEQELALVHQPTDRSWIRVRNRQAGQPCSGARGQRGVGPPWCADQLDQSGHHLHTDGAAGAEFPARRRDARDDRDVSGRSGGHTGRHRRRRSVSPRPRCVVHHRNRCARRRWRRRRRARGHTANRRLIVHLVLRTPAMRASMRPSKRPTVSPVVGLGASARYRMVPMIASATASKSASARICPASAPC
jgi:hypothetical protein